MAEPFREDYPNNPYRVDPIYIRMTTPRNTSDGRGSLPGVQDLFGSLSQTSQFKVSLFLGDSVGTGSADRDLNSWLVSCGVLGENLSSLRYDFMCYSTTLPGNTFATYEESGSRQGLTEKFPYMRTFPEVSLDFFVDADYGLIRLFEEWMNFINPLYTDRGNSKIGSPRGSTSDNASFDHDNIFKLRYPLTYKRTITVTKFERNIRVDSKGNVLETPPMLTYKFINAFPNNLTAMNLSYEGTSITKTSVSFNYDRYVVLKHNGTGTPYYDKLLTQSGQNILFANSQLVTGSPVGNIASLTRQTPLAAASEPI
jgi:hypothetical protein